MDKTLIPLITAIISAAAILAGYAYQRYADRQAERRKNRQEIYSRLIVNITSRMAMLERLQSTPEWQNALDYREQYAVALKDQALARNLEEQKEISAFLSLYGTDSAVKAYADFLADGWDADTHSAKGADIGKLMLGLRLSIYPDTKVTAREASLVILNDAARLEDQ